MHAARTSTTISVSHCPSGSLRYVPLPLLFSHLGAPPPEQARCCGVLILNSINNMVIAPGASQVSWLQEPNAARNVDLMLIARPGEANTSSPKQPAARRLKPCVCFVYALRSVSDLPFRTGFVPATATCDCLNLQGRTCTRAAPGCPPGVHPSGGDSRNHCAAKSVVRCRPPTTQRMCAAVSKFACTQTQPACRPC